MEEFIHKFNGFGNSQSQCLIRILDEEHKPLVVICAQGDIKGTSITNVAEKLFMELQDYFVANNITLSQKIAGYIKENRWSKIASDLINSLEKKGNITSFAIESIKLALEAVENFKNRNDKIRNLIWIEHYPKSFGSAKKPWNMKVTFEPDSWAPIWTPVSLEELAQHTGYPLEYFLIPPEKLDSL